MISNVKHGWCKVSIPINDKNNFTFMASYLTDVPIDLLQCFVDYFKSGKSVCWMDGEGCEMSIVNTPSCTYIINDTENIDVLISSVSISKLAVELVEDIQSQLDDCVNWEFGELSEMQQYQRNKYICRLCEELSNLLKNPKYK